MLTMSTRPLSENEKKTVTANQNDSKQKLWRDLFATWIVGSIISATLGVCVRLAASGVPDWVVVAFAVALLLLLGAWQTIELCMRERRKRKNLAEAVRTGTVNVLRVAADKCVEVEEIEDEGACYLFQVGEDDVLLLHGQEYYESEDFPNTDFTLSIFCDSSGRVFDFSLVKHGQKLNPVQVIGRDIKKKLSEETNYSLFTEIIRGKGNVEEPEKTLRALAGKHQVIEEFTPKGYL